MTAPFFTASALKLFLVAASGLEFRDKGLAHGVLYFGKTLIVEGDKWFACFELKKSRLM